MPLLFSLSASRISFSGNAGHVTPHVVASVSYLFALCRVFLWLLYFPGKISDVKTTASEDPTLTKWKESFGSVQTLPCCSPLEARADHCRKNGSES